MKKSCAFTICAKNYIGLAKVLRQSFIKHNPNRDFYIFVADEFDNGTIELDEYIIISKDVLTIPPQNWINMTFKYDITEFCTSIKPFCFKYLLNSLNYEKVCYLDPDCFVFSTFDYIYTNLDQYSFIVSPHITKPQFDQKQSNDRTFLQAGIYNLGFLAVRASERSSEMLEWWSLKLINECFDDVLSYTFTDQKWTNYLSAFYDNNSLLVSNHLGLNVAPWNYSERKATIKQNSIDITYRESREFDNFTFPLIFAHYSGFKYIELLSGRITRREEGKFKYYADIDNLIEIYIKALNLNREECNKFLSLTYSYGQYDNGIRIDKIHRRIYAKLSSLNEEFPNPFLSSNGRLFNSLKSMKMISNSPQNIDRLNTSDIQNVEKKLVLFNKLMRLLYKIIGYKNYLALLRLLKHFSRLESQTFLIDKEMMDKSI